MMAWASPVLQEQKPHSPLLLHLRGCACNASHCLVRSGYRKCLRCKGLPIGNRLQVLWVRVPGCPYSLLLLRGSISGVGIQTASGAVISSNTGDLLHTRYIPTG